MRARVIERLTECRSEEKENVQSLRICTCAHMRVQIQDPNLEIHFKAIDVVFTIIFLLELLTNMACNWSEMLII